MSQVKLSIAFLGLLLVASSSSAALIVNGSFETGNYSGWTLAEVPGTSGNTGIWGNVASGTTITSSTQVFDYFNGVLATSGSPGLPRTYTATDGTRLAIQLQNGPEFHRMYQDIALGVSDSTLTWDMLYQNHNSGGFIVNTSATGVGDGQYLAIRLRDTSDNLLSTLFVTNPGDPSSISMTAFSRDISAFAGTTVRLSVEMDVDNYFFDAAFDNFRVQSTVPEPASCVIWGALGIAGLVAARRRKKVAA